MRILWVCKQYATPVLCEVKAFSWKGVIWWQDNMLKISNILYNLKWYWVLFLFIMSNVIKVSLNQFYLHCFPELEVCWSPSTVDNTLTMNKYLIQLFLNYPFSPEAAMAHQNTIFMIWTFFLIVSIYICQNIHLCWRKAGLRMIQLQYTVLLDWPSIQPLLLLPTCFSQATLVKIFIFPLQGTSKINLNYFISLNVFIIFVQINYNK